MTIALPYRSVSEHNDHYYKLPFDLQHYITRFNDAAATIRTRLHALFKGHRVRAAFRKARALNPFTRNVPLSIQQ